MKHLDLFLNTQKKIVLITAFLVTLGLLSVVAAAVGVGNLVVQMIKLAIILFSCHALYTGQNWAKQLITIVSAFSIYQGILSIITGTSTIIISTSIIMTLGFIAIIWYINSSKEFDHYIILVKNGTSISKVSFKSFNSIIGEDQVIEVDHKNINTPADYEALSQKLIELAKVNDQVIAIRSAPQRVSIETAETMYEVVFNDKLAILDLNFIHRFNSVIVNFRQKHLFYIIYPESIINPSSVSIHVAYLGSKTRDLARRNGYLKQ